MELQEIEKRFPAYFENFSLPECAAEQEIEVYRACETRKIERASFLNTYEEKGFEVPVDMAADDPRVYSLSTYENPKDLKRFVAIDAKFSPPFLMAKGTTHPSCGPSCPTRKWKGGKGSHVDWWLYEGAEPWVHFVEVDYDEELARFRARKGTPPVP